MPFPSPNLYPKTTLYPQDVTGPKSSFSSGPDSAVTIPSAEFNLLSNEPGSTFEVRLDGGEWGPSSGANKTVEETTTGFHALNGAKPGLHKLELRSIDSHGNVGAIAFYEWIVNKTRIAIRQNFVSSPNYVIIRDPKTNQIVSRWAQDDPRAAFSIQDLKTEDEMPGGYKSMSGTLARSPRVEWFDIQAYNRIQVEAVGRRLIFDGYMDKEADVSGDYLALAPSALGPQSILNDNKTKFGAIDSDMRKFGSPPTARAVALAAYHSVQTGTGLGAAGAAYPPGFIVDFNRDVKEAGVNFVGEGWYYGEGLRIAKLLFSTFDNFGEDASIFDGGYLTDDEAGAYIDSSENMKGQTRPTMQQVVDSTGRGRLFAFFSRSYTGTALGALTNIYIFSYPKVIGQDARNLPLAGAWPYVGFTANWMASQLINTRCSPLTCNVYAMDDSGYVIPQAWYAQEQLPSDILKDMFKYDAGIDWFVYDNLEFQRKRTGTYGTKWKADVVSSGLNEVGLDSQRLWRSITVEWTDINGRSYTTGPPGSGATVESAALEIVDPDHPAVRAGRTRHDTLVVTGTANPAEAITLGADFLENANQLDRSGSATLTQFVQDEMGVFWPVDAVKGGDLISFYNASDDGYRKIVNKGYTEDNKGCEIDLDAPPSGLEALLERLQSGLVSRGIF